MRGDVEGQPAAPSDPASGVANAGGGECDCADDQQVGGVRSGDRNRGRGAEHNEQGEQVAGAGAGVLAAALG